MPDQGGPEPDLLRAWVQRRDEAAFEALVASQMPMVASVCRRVLGESQAADDAVQDAMVALSRDAAAIRGHPGPWLRRTALNAALRRKRQLPGQADADLQAAAVDDSRTEDEHRLWQLAILDECVANLGEDEKDLLVAHFYLQHSQSEIARRQGVTQARIAQRLRKALERLRAQMRRRGVAVSSSAMLLLLAAFSGRRLDGAESGPGPRTSIAVAAGVALLAVGALTSASLRPAAGDAAGATAHPLSIPPAADGAVWLAGGSGWDPAEWEAVIDHGLERSVQVSWNHAVGSRAQIIELGGVKLVAFPSPHGFFPVQIGGLRPRAWTGDPVRTEFVMVLPAVPGYRWWRLRTDWVPEFGPGRKRLYSRLTVVATSEQTKTSFSECLTEDLDPASAEFFHIAGDDGFLQALPAVRRLTAAESAEVRQRCLAARGSKPRTAPGADF